MKFGVSKSANINGIQAARQQQQQQSSSSSSSSSSSCNQNNSEKPDLAVLRVSVAPDACVEGLVGSFMPVENDFTRYASDKNIFEGQTRDEEQKHFRDESNWDSHKRERVKRFRFVICFLGLCAAALAVMSRSILNVSIVDMVTKKDEELLPTGSDAIGPTSSQSLDGSFNIIIPAEDDSKLNETTTSLLKFDTYTPEIKLQWSGMEQNILLGSFHIGYIPSMLVSGGIADKYGAKYPLFACVFGSFIINFLTPHLARFSLHLLIGSRILLGLLHGGMIPSIYDLFNRWLTLAETSIFVPLVKVSLSGGIFVGSMLPGVMVSFGYEWPHVFYMGSFLCSIWSIVWLLLATSTPQTNPLVKPNELHRIMRKKKPPVTCIPTISITNTTDQINGQVRKQTPEVEKSPKESIPWLLIITSPSVIALTFVKFTYNCGMEFWGIELAVYLRKIHDASTTTISAIASGGALLQMALITPIGWSARIAVERKILGFNRTRWRKIFQGLSNFSMAAVYLMLPLLSYDILPAGMLIMLIHLFWMFGAGGESMVPYDLSLRYPATIMGFAHAISVLSGVTIPSICGLILGDFGNEPERWNLLFLALAAALCVGGLVFCLVIKAEPFLPGEKITKVRKNIK